MLTSALARQLLVRPHFLLYASIRTKGSPSRTYCGIRCRHVGCVKRLFGRLALLTRHFNRRFHLRIYWWRNCSRWCIRFQAAQHHSESDETGDYGVSRDCRHLPYNQEPYVLGSCIRTCGVGDAPGQFGCAVSSSGICSVHDSIPNQARGARIAGKVRAELRRLHGRSAQVDMSTA